MLPQKNIMLEIIMGGLAMYDLQKKKGFIVIDGSGIINGEEALAICEKIKGLLSSSNTQNILVDTRRVNLEKSKFDIFINYLSRVKVKKIALVLEELINRFKFSLWSRKYRPQIEIKQFNNLQGAKNWLKGE